MIKRLAASVLFFTLFIGQALATCSGGSLPFNLQNGTLADATQVMSNYNSIISSVNATCAASGANNDITSLGALTTAITPTQGGTSIWIASSASAGSANAQTVTTTTPNGTSFALTKGNSVIFTAGFTNTGPLTLAVNGLTATNTFMLAPGGPLALVSGEVQQGDLVHAVFDGTQFQLFTVHNQFGGYGPFVAVASAATTDLGVSAPGHNANITGTTTITSFGATATTAFPIYRISFSGSLTLTNSASLALPGNTNIQTANGDSATAIYLGSGNWQVINYQRASGAQYLSSVVLPGVNGLSIKLDSTVTNIDVSFNVANLINTASTIGATVPSASLVINSSTNGANGLDTGSRAASTWYNIYIIYNGSTTAGLLSLSSTSPTLPSGYGFFVRVGAMFVNSGNTAFQNTFQKGNIASWLNISPPALPTAGAANQNLSSLVPPTATAVDVSVQSVNSAGDVCQLAANATSGAIVGVINSTANTFNAQVQGRIELTTSQQIVSVGSSNTCTSSFLIGWVDGGVNAN